MPWEKSGEPVGAPDDGQRAPGAAPLRHAAEARRTIETWRREYNTERPHQSLGQHTPAE
jgi:transposase InsO family protein